MSDSDSSRGGAVAAPPASVARGWTKARPAIVAGCGGFVAIALLASLTQSLGHVLLIAPFGATCVLLFALPQSPLARPRNVVGGHLLSTAIGMATLAALGDGPLALAAAVALAITAMELTGTLHPPAGADPLVVLATGAPWTFLVIPVLAGAAVLVGVACLYHRFVSGRPYPES